MCFPLEEQRANWRAAASYLARAKGRRCSPLEQPEAASVAAAGAPGGGPALAQQSQVQFLQPGKVMLHTTSFSLCKLKDNL